MKNKKLLVLAGSFVLMVILAGIPLAAACQPTPSSTSPTVTTPAEETFVLKALTWTNPTRAKKFGLDWISDRLYAKSEGRIRIDYIGSGEVIPWAEQFPSLRSGVIDFLWHAGAVYGSEVPEFHLIHLSKLDTEGRMPPGAREFMIERYEEVNMRFMGGVKYYDPWYVGTTEKINTLDEFKGLLIGTSAPPHADFVRGTGAESVDIITDELYSGLERGVIDGAAFSVTFWTLGLPEVVNYIVMPSYKSNNNVSAWMNLDTWNRLGPELQAVVEEVMFSVMKDGVERDLGSATLNLQVWTAAGVELIQPFTPEEAEWYTGLYNEGNWALLKNSVDPESFAKIESLIEQPAGVELMPRP